MLEIILECKGAVRERDQSRGSRQRRGDKDGVGMSVSVERSQNGKGEKAGRKKEDYKDREEIGKRDSQILTCIKIRPLLSLSWTSVNIH